MTSNLAHRYWINKSPEAIRAIIGAYSTKVAETVIDKQLRSPAPGLFRLLNIIVKRLLICRELTNESHGSADS